MKRTRKQIGLALVASLGLVAAACGGDDSSTTTTAPPAETTTPDDTSAPDETDAPGEAVCPTNLVIQTDWWPELEHGGTYQLIGPGGSADASSFAYSGPIQPQYAAGGVETVEIRAGGDAINFAPVTSEMYTRDEITFGYVNMSDAMKDQATSPVVGVMKTLEINPQMLMWDPERFDIEAPEDMAATGAEVLHFDGTAYIDFLIGQGYITDDQPNPSYGGSPSNWIASEGNLIQQGFATNEIYKYENEIEWKDGAPAPVDYFLINDLGFGDYPATMAVRADRFDDLGPCLEVLVPKLAQAWVDFYDDPAPITDALIGVNETYDTYWTLSEELNAAGLALLEDRGIGANSSDGTYCSFDDARVSSVADILKPIYEDLGIQVVDDLTVAVDDRYCAGAPGR